MHALLEALALKDGCEASGSDTVYAPNCRLSEVFTSWTSLTIDDATGDLLIVDSADSAATFRVAHLVGEEVEVSEEPAEGAGSSSSS